MMPEKNKEKRGSPAVAGGDGLGRTVGYDRRNECHAESCRKVGDCTMQGERKRRHGCSRATGRRVLLLCGEGKKKWPRNKVSAQGSFPRGA